MPSDLHLETTDNRTDFAPGDEVTGIASWALDEAPGRVELRLFWTTRGKGTTDTMISDTISFAQPGTRDAKPFTLTLPPGPHSYSGTLVSVVWAIELVVLPGQEVQRLELTSSR